MKKLLLVLFLLVPTHALAIPFLADGQYTFTGNLTIDQSLTGVYPQLVNGSPYIGTIQLRTPYPPNGMQITTMNIRSENYNFNLWGLTSAPNWRAITNAINGPVINTNAYYRGFTFNMVSGTFTISYMLMPSQEIARITGIATPFEPIPQQASISTATLAQSTPTESVPEPSTLFLMGVGTLFAVRKLHKRNGAS